MAAYFSYHSLVRILSCSIFSSLLFISGPVAYRTRGLSDFRHVTLPSSSFTHPGSSDDGGGFEHSARILVILLDKDDGGECSRPTLLF